MDLRHVQWSTASGGVVDVIGINAGQLIWTHRIGSLHYFVLSDGSVYSRSNDEDGFTQFDIWQPVQPRR